MFLLYDSIIAPIELFLEVFFQLVRTVSNNTGVAVISLSVAVTLFTLPLYAIAEKWQECERQMQDKMRGGVERIKKAFKGDEQYMILNVFYKENHYHPIMSLRSSFSLIIQIPFFIAAYNFLSDLEALKGYSFLFIKDFALPDAIFKMGAFSINILPITMTLINCVAGWIYSKGHPIREQAQIYICALVFLILLYNSPSGLVVYWTMNNIFSLTKNIFYKIRNPKKVIYIICCTLAFFSLLLPFTAFRHLHRLYKIAFFAMSILLTNYPIIVKGALNFFDANLSFQGVQPSRRFLLFITSSLAIVLLSGLTIPSTLIESQPDLYCFIDSYTSPFPFITVTSAKAIGLFLIWPVCIYFFFNDRVKNALAFLFFISAIYSIINTFCFSGKYGSIAPTLLFMEPQYFFPTTLAFLTNAAIFVFIFFIALRAIQKHIVILHSISFILLISLTFISAVNVYSINENFSKMSPPPSESENVTPIYHLSKTGKNVIIFMQDSCLTSIIPDIFNNIPDLKKRFSGFTYYPNTVSLGSVTMTGSPGLFGGYDYTPYEINRRTDKTLQQKHNEALLTLPVLFKTEGGYDITVSNLPYENYYEEPRTAMYDGYEYIRRVSTKGRYSKLWYKKYGLTESPQTSFLIKRNFICFSIFKMLPPVLRGILYSHEYWIAKNPYKDTANFVDEFASLEFLPQLTDSNSNNNSFIVIDNESTHADFYVESKKIPSNNSSPYSEDSAFKIQSDVMIKYADFFDFLKKNNLYNNTRIIIVSDHGRFLKSNVLENIPYPRLTATLLVKDFNCDGDLIIDKSFMTNADTPSIATKNIFDNPKNPFTHNALEVLNKQDYIKIAVPNAESTRIRHNKQFKIDTDKWVTVHDDIYEKDNWSRL